MVPAAALLPLAERHMVNNTAFICTDHHRSALQMLPALVENLVLLEKGVEMMLPNSDPVVVIAPLHFISADNARRPSEIASLMPCRKCTWKRSTEDESNGGDYYYNCDLRSQEVVVKQMHQEFIIAGDRKKLENKVTGQALLRLEAFDAMADCQIEKLHTTIMLGKIIFAS
ncbi:hypothetical protein PS15p_202424 [Mucor circinelloides]